MCTYPTPTLEGEDLNCPHPPIGACADPDCGDEACSWHLETCASCDRTFCLEHIRYHGCPQPIVTDLERQLQDEVVL